MGNIEYSIESFESNLKSSYIDSSISADSRYSPKIIANDAAQASNLLSVLKSELASCDRFDFAVAFIADSGLQTLIEALNILRDRGIPGRFITSTYLNFNSPQALRKLLEYPNIEVRVYQGNMHAKGYLFDKGDLSTVIIGSSNLTQTALTCNKEWNVLFHSYGEGQMLKSAYQEYENLWRNSDTAPLSESWLEDYEQYLQTQPRETQKPKKAFSEKQPEDTTEAYAIKPNTMQKHALEALAVLHKRDEQRALLVSATGTGKTYLSAMEIAAVKPRRVLFVAHRTRILEASLKSFERVLGAQYSYGLYGAGTKHTNASCLFAMVSTLSGHLDEFDRGEFDYIIIDEAHRTGAHSYQKIMQYFKPRFYLGMTATPSRTDGYDVYALFNHVIAYRITLQDALENEMLAPFHYFGIADLEINDEIIDDPGLFAKLTSNERVKHIVQKIEEYTINKTNRRGLIFCNRNDEARSLSTRFNELGYRTVALSGKNTDAERNRAIERLESGELEYIFSVDILNEGIDIPSLNQIIMLRRTESAIVFVQQLGRGLRLTEDKEYTLVLDFIGNYQKNYFVPIALSGDRTYVKDNLRRIVKEGSTAIPGCSTVTFDRISEGRIFTAIDGGKFSSVKLIRDEYTHLKQVLGRIPRLKDFDENQSLDPLIMFKSFDSYHAFLEKHEKEYHYHFDDAQEKMLKFVSKKLAAGKRLEELLILKLLLSRSSLLIVEYSQAFQTYTNRELNLPTLASAINHLQGGFSSTDMVPLAYLNDGVICRSSDFEEAMSDNAFSDALADVLDFGISRFIANYRDTYRDTNFVLNAKYTYEEVCLLLNWEKNINGQNIGGYKYDKPTNTYPVFINYDKAPDISDSIKYEDRFESDSDLIAISKQPRSLSSPEIERLRNNSSNGMKTYLFVRKNKDDKDGGKEFYFLGEMHPTGQFKPITVADTKKPAVEITYKLDSPVRADIYDYIISSFE